MKTFGLGLSWCLSTRSIIGVVLAAVLAVSALVPFAAQAATRALLIGVSDYDNSIGLADLRGPANDVRLLRDVLTERGVADLRLLADGVETAERPTRKAIMAALAKLVEDSKSGDLAIIHFSGHGTRQIDANGDEQDGFDEVFLPSDVTRAPSDTGLIPNAILDEEIGAAVRKLRSSGVDVWTIMDFCHAGTGLRSGGRETASRFVDPVVLGASAKPAAISPAGPRWFENDKSDDALAGGLVAFYAAQAHEVAREVNFAAGQVQAQRRKRISDKENGWYGLFTSKIANRLRSSPGITYRQLFQAVLADMNDTSVPGGARLQTPAREGTLFDATVLGGKRTVGVRQYPVSFDELNAGQVHGIVKGTVVELFDDAAAPKEAGIGFAQVEETRTLLSFLRPVNDGCSISGEALCAADGSLPESARFARVVLRPNNFTLTLSPVIDLKTGQRAAETDALVVALRLAVDQLNASRSTAIRLGDAAYSIEVGLADGGLWFGRSVSQNGVPVGLSWKPDGPVKIERLLLRMMDAQRIAATMDAIADGGSPLSPSPVDVSVDIRSSDVAMLEQRSGRVPPRRECGRVQRRNAYDDPRSLENQSLLKQCDMLRPAAQAVEEGQFDVNSIHIDSQFCARTVHTRIDGSRSQVALGSPMIVCSDCPGGRSTGNERLYVLKTKAEDNADQLDLSQSLNTCSEASRTRSAQGNALQNLIRAVGRKPGTRGAFGGMAPGDVWVKRFEWNVVPRDRALELAGK